MKDGKEEYTCFLCGYQLQFWESFELTLQRLLGRGLPPTKRLFSFMSSTPAWYQSVRWDGRVKTTLPSMGSPARLCLSQCPLTLIFNPSLPEISTEP